MPRSKLTLNNGRECEVGSCPCDERGDKLRALVDSAAAEGLSMGARIWGFSRPSPK
jgi:hypothetical protein